MPLKSTLNNMIERCEHFKLQKSARLHFFLFLIKIETHSFSSCDVKVNSLRATFMDEKQHCQTGLKWFWQILKIFIKTEPKVLHIILLEANTANSSSKIIEKSYFLGVLGVVLDFYLKKCNFWQRVKFCPYVNSCTKWILDQLKTWVSQIWSI